MIATTSYICMELPTTCRQVNVDSAEEGAAETMQSEAYWNVYKVMGCTNEVIPTHFFDVESPRVLWSSCVNSLVTTNSATLEKFLKNLECEIISSCLHIFIQHIYIHGFKINEPSIVFEAGGGILAGSCEDSNDFFEVSA